LSQDVANAHGEQLGFSGARTSDHDNWPVDLVNGRALRLVETSVII
jgi:hypothetical protein